MSFGNRRGRVLIRAASVVALSAGLALTATAPALAHDPEHGDKPASAKAKREQYTAGVSVPLVSTPNIRHVGNFPETAAISGVFAKSAPYFYVSSLDSVSVFDVSDPLRPRLTGTLPNLLFENEAVNYGEVRRGDRVERFLLLGVDLYQASPGDISHVNAGGGEVVVVDVTDPANPRIRSRVSAPTSTHTVACVRETDCRYAYTAGDTGQASIIDLTDLDAPALAVDRFPSPAAGPNPVFSSGAGHKWNFDNAGFGVHTGSGGTAIFDVRDPARPALVTTTGADGVAAGWNDFIHHNSDRPNADRFTPGSAPSVENGNVILVTEEDYENTDCATAGSFQTWHVETLDGTPSAIKKLDKINPVDLGEGVVAPHMAFCSAHWFDYHSSGIVAAGFYEAGLRLLDVRDPRDIKEYGYFASGLSEVWDAYWVPERTRNGVATGKKTNIVYTADLVRGLDVFTVALPGAAAAPSPLPVVTAAMPTPVNAVFPGGAIAAVLGLVTLIAGGLLYRRRRTA
ncbi:hypothetical protein SAMN05192558_101283 [Actinokineospora alba]|uniref:LVIVD repeat-containing protein n=1 Tax=Actinokineospora alba TaxID=504798 RepID=A0A1H0F9D2_9PSEU|nr:hypothetical protein [Actinokineospora alba]TDP69393.1 hypothetical protein C8E96_4979 [Actinokineospora alba]SDI17659.1 hypothetical protein SAMN05421871_103587 [Actinokineospora alba]SDN91246.1 hypothetical protein SAMN05192558_101283 [Actinokineospora alba]